jgi:hypothetical protein
MGTGFGDRSPAFRVLVDFQNTLSWPLLFRCPALWVGQFELPG